MVMVYHGTSVQAGLEIARAGALISPNWRIVMAHAKKKDYARMKNFINHGIRGNRGKDDREIIHRWESIAVTPKLSTARDFATSRETSSELCGIVFGLDIPMAKMQQYLWHGYESNVINSRNTVTIIDINYHSRKKIEKLFKKCGSIFFIPQTEEEFQHCMPDCIFIPRGVSLSHLREIYLNEATRNHLKEQGNPFSRYNPEYKAI